MSFKYAILGAGRQGSAAAYDLAVRGEANSIILADQDLKTATEAVSGINRLVGKEIAHAAKIDATESESVKSVLQGVDAVLSAVPYYYNLQLARLAIENKCHFVDLGGNTDIVQQQHGFDLDARRAGVSVVPDCGQVPGMGTSLMVYAVNLLDEAEEVFMWDGGLPQKPTPPFNYLLTFNIAGLTNEYAEPGIFLRDGAVTLVEPMTELEVVEFPEPIGALEAFVTGGGTSTMPWAYEGKLRTLQNLTLRWPGHYQQLKAYWDLGLWGQEPVAVNGQTVIPRDVFHALFEPKVVHPEERDVVLIRVKAKGQKGGRRASATVELIDYFDEVTGFSAMQRTTGWDAAIVLAMAARRQISAGAGGVELMVPAGLFVGELHRRGFKLSERIELEE